MKLDSVQYCDAEFHNEIYRRCNPELGDILFTKDGANTGNVAINELDEPFSLLSSVCLLKPDRAKLTSGFLSYYLQSKEGFDQITGQMTGAAIKRIILKTIKSSRIPLPPLPEQKAIVAILDDAFGEIATAVANTEKNLVNAHELFESYLSSVFSQRGEGWTERPLESLVDRECSLSYGIVQPGIDVQGGLPVVRPMDLTDRIVTRHRLKAIDPSIAKGYSRTRLHGGDLLLCVRGSTGVVSVADSKLKGANVTRGIVPIRFDPSLVTQDIGYYILRSPNVQRQIAEKTYGAALMQINIRDLRKIQIIIPPFEKHDELLASLDHLSAEAHRLQSIYQQKLTALAELKQSLLQKAFSGELAAGKEVSDAIREAEEVA